MLFRDINKKPSQWFISKNLIVKESEIHGLGVFATGEFERFEILEASPVIPFSRDAMENDWLDKNDTFGKESTWGKRFIIFDYVFSFEKLKRTVCIGLGYASLYNHARESNAVWKIIPDKKEIQIRAKRKIEKGEEITISYLHPSIEDDLWF